MQAQNQYHNCAIKVISRTILQVWFSKSKKNDSVREKVIPEEIDFHAGIFTGSSSAYQNNGDNLTDEEEMLEGSWKHEISASGEIICIICTA